MRTGAGIRADNLQTHLRRRLIQARQVAASPCPLAAERSDTDCERAGDGEQGPSKKNAAEAALKWRACCLFRALA